jgi:hypothetical protein
MPHHLALEAQHHALLAAVAALAAGLILGWALFKLAGVLAQIGPRRNQAVAARRDRARALGCRPSQVRYVERLLRGRR